MNHNLKESNLFSNCSRRSCYLRFVYDQKPTATTSAQGSSPSSTEPDHFQVIPTVIVPKRKMGTKQKPKHSFGFESTSRGPYNKPSNVETGRLDLLVHFRMQQESPHGKRQSTEVQNASQGLDSKCPSKDKKATTLWTMSNSKCKRLGAGKSNISSPKSAQGEDEFKVDEVFDHETPRLKVTKQGAVDIMTQRRNFLQENAPSKEHDLWKALSISQVQMTLDMHGTITVLLDRSQLFEVIYDYLYTFVFYNCTDDEDDRLADTFTEFFSDGILQDAGEDVVIAGDSWRGDSFRMLVITGDGVRQGKSVLSSNSSVCVSAGGGGDNELAASRTKNGSSQIPSLCLHHSRALQGMQQTCDAKVQTKRLQPSRITELNSGLQERDVKIMQLKHRPNAIPESQAHQPQQIYDMICTVERFHHHHI
ncbi:hypothetical protein HPB51_027103 [Rhipicephalus microplus]|uniref:Uncharacterized protein n=1 Tax=Rhipicephalus microplus TaxID=6941 RepID=A0A9J6D168_RHIMP|nr:hypothetical protein HPB51_027103 [Rhipicephalus microplus]